MRRSALLVLAMALVLAGCGDDRPELPEGVELTPLTEEQVRELARGEAMRILQSSMAAQMRLYVAEGRFTTDADELDLPEGLTLAPRVGPGEGPETVAVQVCEDEAVVVLGTISSLEDAFAVKARGLEPHEEGEAVFSHYTDAMPPCDSTDGPETWPEGWHVSREGLQGPVEETES